MKRFYIIVNMEKELAEGTADLICSYLKNHAGSASCILWKGPERDSYEIPDGTDCIITIGGDGTLIRTARATVSLGIPLIGINRGHLGYLTELTREEDIIPAIDRLLADDYQIEERMMLRSQVVREGKCIYRDLALNEVLLTRFDSLRTIHFQVHVNGTFLNSYSSDGLIVATPTGSTAYSLSAGGPIAKPDSRLMIVTPICSHTINARALIFSPDDKIRLIPEGDGQITACDGDEPFELQKGDEVRVRRSRYAAKLVRLSEESFLETLRDKMTFV